ncbi:MAG: hypothetical protein JWM98_1002, partial [Thermoleophilia bacterium]|nr:hypothetical protein [Thermoleophilia bacterium]
TAAPAAAAPVLAAAARPVVAPRPQSWARDANGRAVPTGGAAGQLFRALRENAAPIAI